MVPVDGGTTSIDRAWAAVRDAARPRLHVFTSNEYASDDSGAVRPPAELLTETREAVKRASSYTNDVEFSPLQADGNLTGLVAAMAEVAVDAGATTINVRTCPEPADYAETYRELLVGLLALAPALKDVTLSADCFSRSYRGTEASDEALACACVAIELGVRQIKCALHGTAATPGHVRMEELSLQAWSGRLPRTPPRTRLDQSVLLATSAKIAAIKGYVISPSDPFVGTELESPSPETSLATRGIRSARPANAQRCCASSGSRRRTGWTSRGSSGRWTRSAARNSDSSAAAHVLGSS